MILIWFQFTIFMILPNSVKLSLYFSMLNKLLRFRVTVYKAVHLCDMGWSTAVEEWLNAGQLFSAFLLYFLCAPPSSHFFSLENEEMWLKMDSYRRVHKKIEEICFEISQRTRKRSVSDWFCPNKQFDGGFFDWVSENFIFLEQKLALFFFVLEL